ncbi:hypothetical protein [Goodfellowiella coeruleoviolacea]|uniref:Lipoprotein n=1 Tax=Goodfellowiella coeruleoviolacea TaxID=334858 RepID=A0AAE3KL45_9PSEU|nr:hypothetical protein [Goodfellowiella coeruleoviolacea]MCP2166133.1 hypothetical protein [Goodfellowiella coeruleoviolacea]
MSARPRRRLAPAALCLGLGVGLGPLVVACGGDGTLGEVLADGRARIRVTALIDDNRMEVTALTQFEQRPEGSRWFVDGRYTVDRGEAPASAVVDTELDCRVREIRQPVTGLVDEPEVTDCRTVH